MRSDDVLKTVDTFLRIQLSTLYCITVSSTEEVVSLCQELRAICQKGGFTLRQWISNSHVVLASIPEKEKAEEVKNLDLDPYRESIGSTMVCPV